MHPSHVFFPVARLARLARLLLIAGIGCLTWSAKAQEPASAVPSSPPAAEASREPADGAASQPARRWLTSPRVYGRLKARDLGVVINTGDPYSVEVGEHYIRARGIPASQVLRLSLPLKGALSAPEFEAFRKRIDDHFGDRVQGLALVWRQPYAVECHAITGALAMGFDPALCKNSCAPSKPSRYFASPYSHPHAELGMRISMLVAAPDVASGKALVDRGVRSDGLLRQPGVVPANVHFVTTSDAVRSVRQALYPPAGPVSRFGLNVHLDQTDALRGVDRVLIYMTGRMHVDWLDTVRFLPGALADHLTSFGGVLDKPHGQMTVMSWIQAGATATHGTASEPCAHVQKFPHPQALLSFYAQGSTALEAYWKSVAWPQQSLFVGEPLAAPFGK